MCSVHPFTWSYGPHELIVEHKRVGEIMVIRTNVEKPVDWNGHPTKTGYPLSRTEVIMWRQNYPTYNNSNLEKEDVIEFSGQQNYLFMSKNQPVVEILRTNKEILNADIDKKPLIDQEW